MLKQNRTSLDLLRIFGISDKNSKFNKRRNRGRDYGEVATPLIESYL